MKGQILGFFARSRRQRRFRRRAQRPPRRVAGIDLEAHPKASGIGVRHCQLRQRLHPDRRRRRASSLGVSRPGGADPLRGAGRVDHGHRPGPCAKGVAGPGRGDRRDPGPGPGPPPASVGQRTRGALLYHDPSSRGTGAASATGSISPPPWSWPEPWKNATAIEARVKWPNDILVNGKKLCGMLSELDAEGDLVTFVNIGIGINVNNDPAPRAARGRLRLRAHRTKGSTPGTAGGLSRPVRGPARRRRRPGRCHRPVEDHDRGP